MGRSFLFRRGRGEVWVFSIVHREASPPLVERGQVSSFWRQGGSQKPNLGPAALVASILLPSGEGEEGTGGTQRWHVAGHGV